MRRIGVIIMAGMLFACTDEKKPEDQKSEPEGPVDKFGEFSKQFKTVNVPYQLADSDLLGNKDRDTIRGTAFSEWIPDSVRATIFGKGRVNYMPLAKMETSKGENFFIVKAESNRKKAALLLSFGKDQQYGAAFPFLVPDADGSTTQVSTIDKSYSVSRGVLRKMSDDEVNEGKDVYVYNNDAKQFILIMTDLLDDKNADLINPIDTLSRQHKLAGDYLRDKKNIVSIRDGRKPTLLTVFVHTEKDKSECTGELKGDAEITSPTTAVYRQAGDPCVLQLNFTPAAVTLKELEGCGSHRGLECAFEGTFPRKKEPKKEVKSRSTKNSKKKS